jgi:hypothetical protein
MVLEGTSNIHDWRAEGNLIIGLFEIDPGLLPGGSLANGTARAEVAIPVANLLAVGRTWEPDNEQITTAMLRILRSGEHPRIYCRIFSLAAATNALVSVHERAFDAGGELVIAGVTNPIAMPVTLKTEPGGKLSVSGTVKLRQSKFALRPPPNTLDWYDNDTVKVSFEWRLEEKKR